MPNLVTVFMEIITLKMRIGRINHVSGDSGKYISPNTGERYPPQAGDSVSENIPTRPTGL